MKKTIIALTLLSTASTAIANQEFGGFRIGGGLSISATDYLGVNQFYTVDGSGLRLEAGYDINKIVGISVINENSSGSWYNEELDTRTTQITADIGYAFETSTAYLKPFGRIGLGVINGTAELNRSYGTVSESVNESGIVLGGGFRSQFKTGFYTELSSAILVTEWADQYQFSATLGYKF
ncbi:porin family protein [uncultured Vibrio sp.]|uniref:porin family protein n=1 Tax=uncultured Vibrio sp. TaxID=114054 RepID=UPI0025FEA6AA|nr:porin family protein [uncultured Vibrio sp.]